MKEKFFTLLWVSLSVIAGVMLYHTSGEVHHINKSIKQIDRQILKEQHTIAVLNAEFYSLTSLERIEKLTVKYLPDLQSVKGDQLLSNIKELPKLEDNPKDNIDNIAKLIERTLNKEKLQPKPVNKSSSIIKY